MRITTIDHQPIVRTWTTFVVTHGTATLTLPAADAAERGFEVGSRHIVGLDSGMPERETTIAEITDVGREIVNVHFERVGP